VAERHGHHDTIASSPSALRVSPYGTSRVGTVTVAVLTRTKRDLVSELELTASRDRVPTDCVVNFDNLHTIPREALRRRVTSLTQGRMAEACRALRDALGC
jgi:mRNA interferase MazF